MLLSGYGYASVFGQERALNRIGSVEKHKPRFPDHLLMTERDPVSETLRYYYQAYMMDNVHDNEINYDSLSLKT
jgi:hypothetical protein